MSRLLAAFLSAGLLAIAGHPASAHHSMAEYEFLATTIEGTVQSFKYTNPHCILVLKTSGGEGGARVWHLEGPPPAWLDPSGRESSGGVLSASAPMRVKATVCTRLIARGVPRG